jgi:penicillin-binding protein 1A
VGYDDHQPLGNMETGGHAALPIWMSFMKVAIADKPNEHFPGDAAPTPPTNLAKSIPPSAADQSPSRAKPRARSAAPAGSQASPSE